MVRRRGGRKRALGTRRPMETPLAAKLVFHVMGALAEFARSLIVERTRAGMTAARTRGRRLGRPVKLTGAQLRKAEEGRLPLVAKPSPAWPACSVSIVPPCGAQSSDPHHWVCLISMIFDA